MSDGIDIDRLRKIGLRENGRDHAKKTIAYHIRNALHEDVERHLLLENSMSPWDVYDPEESALHIAEFIVQQIDLEDFMYDWDLGLTGSHDMFHEIHSNPYYLFFEKMNADQLRRDSPEENAKLFMQFIEKEIRQHVNHIVQNIELFLSRETVNVFMGFVGMMANRPPLIYMVLDVETDDEFILHMTFILRKMGMLYPSIVKDYRHLYDMGEQYRALIPTVK